MSVIQLEEAIFVKTTREKRFGDLTLVHPYYTMTSQQRNLRFNGVKGNVKISSRTSPGGKLLAEQDTFDRHPVTGCNTRENMMIAT